MRSDIIGGLKIALSKGQKLQEAMQSFYNAGYKKEEIEEAAKILKTEGFQPVVIKKPEPNTIKKTDAPKDHPKYNSPPQKQIQPVQKPIEKIVKKEVLPKPPPPEMRPPVVAQQPQMVPRQTISAYGAQKEKSGIDFMTVMLVIILILLVGVLVGVFFFKDQIVQFLNTILE